MMADYTQGNAAYECLTMRYDGVISRQEEDTHQALLWCIANPNGPERYADFGD